MMNIKVWSPEMSLEETKDLAYWERNMLALHFAEGWYNDDVAAPTQSNPDNTLSRYPGWRRVLSLEKGKITFHIPNGFDVGNLQKIEPNWDGHTTKEKWKRIAELALLNSHCGGADQDDENKVVLSHEMSKAFEWDSWRDKIPALKFPAHWEVKIIPPSVGAIIRFLVRGKNEWVSVYLDGYNLLGHFSEPYWEIYPDADDNTFRCPMPDTPALIAAIEAALDRTK